MTFNLRRSAPTWRLQPALSFSPYDSQSDGLSRPFHGLSAVLPRRDVRNLCPEYSSASGGVSRTRETMNFTVGSAFIDAMRRCQVDVVKGLINKHSIDVNRILSGPPEPMTWTGFAAKIGHKAIVELLLQSGARVNDSAHTGKTALHFAAAHGHVDVISLLLAHGADVSARDDRGRSVLSFAASSSSERSVIVVVEAGAPLEPADACATAAAKSVAVVQALFERGVAVKDLRTTDGSSPLHIAACSDGDADNKLAVAAQLIKVYGVDVNAADCENCTASHCAALNGMHDLLRLFIDANAHADCVDSNGQTPLMYSCIGKRIQCMLLLLAAGVDVHATDSSGRTAACHWAADSENAAEALSYLVAAGADINTPDKNGVSPSRFGNAVPTAESIERARRRIAMHALALVRQRALQVCIGLYSLDLDALQMCEILRHACGPFARMVALHHWWQVATAVKHFVFAVEC